MPTFLFKGIKELGGIPRHSRVRVEALPKRTVVFNGGVSGSIALELDEGKYAFSVSCFPEKKPGRKYNGTFLWGVTEEQFNRLKDLEPRAAKKMNTTEGPRYFCQYTGCDVELSSRTGAVLHEAEHQGRLGDLISDTNDERFMVPKLISGATERAQRKIARLRAAQAAERAEQALQRQIAREMPGEPVPMDDAEIQAALDAKGHEIAAEKVRHQMKQAQKAEQAATPPARNPKLTTG